jgi:hypothetical protein
MSRVILLCALVLGLSAFHTHHPYASGPDETAASPAATVTLDPPLDAVRKATARFRDVNVAIAEGYILPEDYCATATHMGLPAEYGGMGLHFVRPDLLQITELEPRVNGVGTHTDFLTPAVLIYEPQADGSLELVAVENLVFVDAWHAAGNTEPPMFAGVPFDYMVNDPDTELDEAHGFEAHYDLHVWIYRENPLGVFAQFNPNVTCEHHKPQGEHHHH